MIHFGNLCEAGTIIFKRYKLAKFKWILKDKANGATARTGLTFRHRASCILGQAFH